jgi:DNA-binding CsgD family transcriptional regulator
MLLLTPAERRVAKHASAGLTTRQVARKLDVSEKTVDAQLQSIYRKLRVRSRSQLVVALTAPARLAATASGASPSGQGTTLAIALP